MKPSSISRTWRWIFFIEVPLCVAVGGFWLLAPEQYLSQAYGVEVGDRAHVGLLRQLAFTVLTILGWFYGRWLLGGPIELRPFRYFQEGLALGDVLIIANAVHAAAVGQLEGKAAVAQIIPAALWLAVRVVFLLAHADRRSSASASRS